MICKALTTRGKKCVHEALWYNELCTAHYLVKNKDRFKKEVKK